MLCPVPGKKYPGAGSEDHEREILPFRVFLAAAGCLRSERWKDPTHAATLKKLEGFCGSLQLNEEDEVHEAMSLLMMAMQGFSSTIKAVQRDLAGRCKGNNKTLNLDLFYTAMTFVQGWDSSTTLNQMARGRALFCKADLWPEDVLGVRLYTGPQFMHYNGSLRRFPQWVLDTMLGNLYVTTIHCINSATIKLARASPIDPLVVYRGSVGMRLPLQFAAKDDLGRQGDVELGFMSCTSDKKVALNYAAGGNMAMLLSVERDATNSGAPISSFSFYKNEEEICFPPLCSLEVKGKPQILFTDKGPVLEVKLGITVNQKAETIDGLVGRRQFLHEGMLSNLKREVESELKPVDTLLSTIISLATGVAASMGGSKKIKSEQVLDAFAKEARQTYQEVAQRHAKKSAAEFNDDDEYSGLVTEAVDMKKTALKEGSYYKLLGAWFADCAKADVRVLEAVVRQLDANMWSDARVVDTNTGETPLLAACSAGSVEIVEALIKAGADATALDKNGNTPLLAACGARSYEIYEALIKGGADTSTADKNGNTPLLAACGAGSYEIFEALIKGGADTNTADIHGKTPLLAACGAGSYEICKALIKAGADVRQAPRHDGDATAFTLSVMSGNWSLVELLRKHNKIGLELSSPSPLASASNFLELATAYAQPHGIHARVRDRSALALKAEMGALVALLEQLVEKDSTRMDLAKTRDKVSHARAFVNHHADLLQNPPVALSHAVIQLALQEPDDVFGGNDAQMPAADEDGQSATIEWFNKPQSSRPCQLTIKGEGAVRSVAYSKDGRKLARAEGNAVVVCCAKSGIEQWRLRGHNGQDGCICDCYGNGRLKDEVNPECPVTGHRYALFLFFSTK